MTESGIGIRRAFMALQWGMLVVFIATILFLTDCDKPTILLGMATGTAVVGALFHLTGLTQGMSRRETEFYLLPSTLMLLSVLGFVALFFFDFTHLKLLLPPDFETCAL
jgi:hypothetical protein